MGKLHIWIVFEHIIYDQYIRAKNFRSSARPRRVLSYLGRVDLRKHLSYGTSRVCRKKKCSFLLRSEFLSILDFVNYPEFREVWVLFTATYSFVFAFVSFRFPRISGSVVSVKTGIHIPYMEMTTSFETRLHQNLNEAITIVASRSRNSDDFLESSLRILPGLLCLILDPSFNASQMCCIFSSRVLFIKNVSDPRCVYMKWCCIKSAKNNRN